jgi:hypothetical protein
MQFDYSLSDDSIQHFQENGHVYLPKIISKGALQPYRNAILSWADDFRKQQKPFQERDTYGKAFLQMMNLWEDNDLIYPDRSRCAEHVGKVKSKFFPLVDNRITDENFS